MFGRPKDETGLLRASLDGSAQAFGTLVERYQSLVCAITYSATGSVERSEELAQETFLKAWKCLGQLQDPGKFRPWLCTIARSTVQNWFRGRRHDVVGGAAPLDDAAERASEESGPVEAAMYQEQQAVVREALSQIPESLREPLVLFYREEKSVREVAEQLGLSENAARQRISRGRSRLREQVADMVETTICRTRPGKAFTTAVIAAVAGLTIKGSTAAAAVGAAKATTAAGGTLGVAALMSGLTAKIIAVAAASVALVVGGVVIYRQLTKPGEPTSGPVLSQSVRQEDARTQRATASLPSSGVVANAMEGQAGSSRGLAAAAPAAGEAERTPIDERRIRQATAAAAQAKPPEFKPRGVLSGLVTDKETGAPVPGALVRATKQRIFNTRTDANGFYYFDKVHEPGDFTVAVDSKEYVGISWGEGNPVVPLSPDKQAVQHFQLPKACMVDLWVVDANGVGIKDACVVATSLTDSRRRPVSYFGDLRSTDPNGYILLGGFPPAPTDYLITAWHSVRAGEEEHGGRRYTRMEYAYSPARALVRLTDPNVVQRVELVLEEGQDVQGYVEYADGVPAQDIEISATPAWWHCNYGVEPYKVAGDGTFTLKHIVPGTYDVAMHIVNKDHSGSTSRVVMQAQLPSADHEPLLVRLAEKSPQTLVSISGSLVFLGGQKPRTVWVEAYSPTGGHASTSVRSKPNGELEDTFLLDRLAPGTYTVTFSGENIEDKAIQDVAAPTAGLQVELVYAAKPRLVGVVVDAQTGAPVKDFRIRVRKLRTLRNSNYVQENRWTYVADEGGEFGVDTVGSGVYQVQALAAGYAPAWSKPLSTEEPQPARISLSAGGAVAGRVVNEKGEALTGAKVIPLSLASGTMSTTARRFTSQEGAIETVDGAFTLKNLPAGTETLKITHPDYTFRMVEDIAIAEGKITEGVELVLASGGTVEGRVYDDKGVPQAGEILHFQDDSGYSGSDDEAAGQLGSALTDANGFYRLAHLPQQLCHVKRANEWRSLGVVRRTVVPRNGQTARLDFGGTPIVSGVIVVDGTPLSDTRILLGPPDSPYFGSFECYARTDGQGAFVFGGVIPGSHAIYGERSDPQNRWRKVKTIVMGSTDLNVGVIGSDSSKLLVTVNAPDTRLGGKVASVSLAPGSAVFSVSQSYAARPAEDGKPWTCDDVEPGKYTLTFTRQDQVQWRKEIELEPGRSQWEVAVNLPAATAQVAGHIFGATGGSVILWRESKDILVPLEPAEDGTYHIEALPAGRYHVGDAGRLLDRMPAFAEFDLRDGESKVVDVDLSRVPGHPIVYLVVQVIDENGQARNDARLRAEGPAGTLEPLGPSGGLYTFFVPAGAYVLRADAPGYRNVAEQVVAKPRATGGDQPQKVIIYLERR